MKEYTVNTIYYTWNDVEARASRYAADGSLAIELVSKTEGPIAMLTVCLDTPGLGDEDTFVDVNNCPWAEEFISESGIGEPVGLTKTSGYCRYPLYRFDLNKLEVM